MDVTIKIERWREGVKHAMRREPLFKKLCVAGGAFFTLICCLILGSYQMSSWGDVLMI